MSTPFPSDCLTTRIDQWQLAAEKVAVCIRWFGVVMGYLLVNVVDLGGAEPNRFALNGILTLGAIYAAIDTFYGLRGRVFLDRWPPAISFLEAIFIGLLCFYDRGVGSPFLFYYFLSLVCCAIRYRSIITYSTFAMHAASYLGLAVATFGIYGPSESWQHDIAWVLLTIVVMGWVTWASVALANLLKGAEQRLEQLNEELRQNQAHLEQRIAERTRELSEAHAQMLHQEKMAAFGLLAAGIAHEVGNPLASISSLVQMLEMRHQDRYSREKLALMDDQLRRIQAILRELVNFSRPASRERSRVHIHEVLEAALGIAKYYKHTKGKTVETDYDPSVPPFRTMRDALIQVFLNLILNAMDAAPKEGRIRLQTRADNGHARVRITDNGPGISAEHQARLFQPYFTTKKNGTGLGLFVSRRIVQELGGRLELESAQSGQTTFVVELPVDVPGTEREATDSPLSRAAPDALTSTPPLCPTPIPPEASCPARS